MPRQRRNNKKTQKKKKKPKNTQKSTIDLLGATVAFLIATVGIITSAYTWRYSHYVVLFNHFFGDDSLKITASTPAIESLASAIKDTKSKKIESLVKKYEYDYDDESHAILRSSIDDFFRDYSTKINDNYYEKRLQILHTLMEETKIQHYSSSDMCILNKAVRYRLIDATKLILSSMNEDDLKKCFWHQSKKNNDTIFHQVAKSRSASIARLILKMKNSKNPSFDRYSKRLHLDLTKLSKKNSKNIVYQRDIKKVLSPIDIEMVLFAAVDNNFDTDWYFIRNSEGFTGFDYLKLNYGNEWKSEIIDFINNDEYIKDTIKTVSQNISVDDCNFDKEILHKDSCYPPVIYGWDEFEKYWNAQRPVIIKNVLKTQGISFASFSQRFGHLAVMVSEIPYATLFGERAWSIPIGEYMKKVMDTKSSTNLYAFDKEQISQSVEMQKYFGFSVDFMERNKVRSGYDRVHQLALGPKTSGAPPHFHSPAFNGLFEGRKMWWMFAPTDSMYASMSVGKWIHEEFKKNKYKHYSFIQEKGDVVFVPSQWAHAVNNLENTLAVAIEYDV